MTKRIVSGVFLLIALGALGLILAGALTSGEQLIVRFLTAIIVAALGLYVISDLRLQSESGHTATAARKDGARRTKQTSPTPPANSTAAFMATVTGKKSASGAEEPLTGSTGAETVLGDLHAPVEPVAGTPRIAEPTIEAPVVPAEVALAPPVEASAAHEAAAAQPTLVPVPAIAEGPEESPYSADAEETELWPLTPEGKVVEAEGESAPESQTVTGYLTPEPVAPFVPPAPVVAASDYSSAPLAPIVNLRVNRVEDADASADLEAAIKAGEVEVISSLINDGILTSDGPLLDHDVQTMIYVAFTSTELRKILTNGGMPDGQYDHIDLGEIEVFHDHADAEAFLASAAAALPIGSDDNETQSVLADITPINLDEDVVSELDLRGHEPASSAM